MLLATAACNFCTSQLQKVLWDPQLFSILTWKCASRHSRVQFLNISTSKSAPNLTCTFSLENVLLATAACNFWFLLWPHDSAPAALTSLLLDSPDNVHDFSNIWRGWIFFLLTFVLLHLLSSDSTSSSDFTFCWLYFIYLLFICFSTLHIVGSLLFKLPSTNPYYKLLLRTMKYYSVLHSTQYYKVFQSITPHYNVLHTARS